MSDREEHPQSENEEGGLSSLDLATSQTALRKTKRPHNKDRKEGYTDEEGQEMEEVPKAKDRKSPGKDHNAATRTRRKRRAHREKKGIKDSRMHLSTRVLNAITKHTTVGEDVEEEEAKVYVNPFSIKELKKPDFYTAIFAGIPARSNPLRAADPFLPNPRALGECYFCVFEHLWRSGYHRNLHRKRYLDGYHHLSLFPCHTAHLCLWTPQWCSVQSFE